MATTSIVTINAKPGSRKFSAFKGQMTQFQKVIDATGSETEREAGSYKGERFPNSRQMFRPIWSQSKKMWLMDSFKENCDELNKMALACKFKYPDTHYKRDQYIDEADLFDYNDPFFTHRSLKIITYEGQLTLDKAKPIDKIIFLSLRQNHLFQSGGEEGNTMLSSRTRYVITDKEVDITNKKKRRDKFLEASKLYSSLTDAKKITIAMALGLAANENQDRDLIDQVLWDASQDTAVRNSNKQTRQDLFIGLCKMDNEMLNIKKMVQKAKGSGKLKKVKNQGWLLFGEPVGKTDEQLFTYFSNPENQEMFFRLQEALSDD